MSGWLSTTQPRLSKKKINKQSITKKPTAHKTCTSLIALDIAVNLPDITKLRQTRLLSYFARNPRNKHGNNMMKSTSTFEQEHSNVPCVDTDEKHALFASFEHKEDTSSLNRLDTTKDEENTMFGSIEHKGIPSMNILNTTKDEERALFGSIGESIDESRYEKQQSFKNVSNGFDDEFSQLSPCVLTDTTSRTNAKNSDILAGIFCQNQHSNQDVDVNLAFEKNMSYKSSSCIDECLDKREPTDDTLKTTDVDCLGVPTQKHMSESSNGLNQFTISKYDEILRNVDRNRKNLRVSYLLDNNNIDTDSWSSEPAVELSSTAGSEDFTVSKYDRILKKVNDNRSRLKLAAAQTSLKEDGFLQCDNDSLENDFTVSKYDNILKKVDANRQQMKKTNKHQESCKKGQNHRIDKSLFETSSSNVFDNKKHSVSARKQHKINKTMCFDKENVDSFNIVDGDLDSTDSYKSCFSPSQLVTTRKTVLRPQAENSLLINRCYIQTN